MINKYLIKLIVDGQQSEQELYFENTSKDYLLNTIRDALIGCVPITLADIYGNFMFINPERSKVIGCSVVEIVELRNPRGISKDDSNEQVAIGNDSV